MTIKAQEGLLHASPSTFVGSKGGLVVQWEGERIPRTDLYMAIAQLFAARSTCVRGQVGCVAVRNNRIVCAGYNGSPPRMPHCLNVGCGGGIEVEDPTWRPLTERELTVFSRRDIARHHTLRTRTEFPNGCTRSVHAEQNMVAYAARLGIPLDGCTVYATSGPCLPCAQALVSAGMVRFVYEKPYRLPQGLELVLEARIEVEKYGNQE